MSLAIVLKPVPFPSRSFPSADLCLSRGTKYDFACLSCFATVWVVLDREARHFNGLSRQEENAVIDHFVQFRKVTRTETYGRVKCAACGTEYVLALEFQEPAHGFLRVIVTDAVEIEVKDTDR